MDTGTYARERLTDAQCFQQQLAGLHELMRRVRAVHGKGSAVMQTLAPIALRQQNELLTAIEQAEKDGGASQREIPAAEIVVRQTALDMQVQSKRPPKKLSKKEQYENYRLGQRD